MAMGGKNERGYRIGVEEAANGFIVPEYAPALQASQAIGDPSDQVAYVVAAPLSHGSNPNSNMAGRRREDDVNLVTAFYPTGGSKDGFWQDDVSPPMKVGTGVAAPAGIGIAQTSGVRRLTPTECERLQALPDGWTNPTGDASDSRRYAALGDAVTSSVAYWIGHQLLAHVQRRAA